MAAADPFNFPLLQDSQERDLSLGRQVVECDRMLLGKNLCPLEDIRQLTNVAGPIVGLKQLKGLFLYVPDLFPGFFA